jgi:hypothetical protein
MNPHLTAIAYILDRSGSMQSMQEPAVTADRDGHHCFFTTSTRVGRG